jgi:hypothetical protein
MTGSLRLTDLAFALGVIALAAILVGQQASRASAGAPGPFTVEEAVAFYSDAPMVVRGYLVTRGRRTLLCDRRLCAGERLVVRGGPRGQHGVRPVLALGVVTDRRITLLRLPPAARPARL